jgi:hypothetical protein
MFFLTKGTAREPANTVDPRGRRRSASPAQDEETDTMQTKTRVVACALVALCGASAAMANPFRMAFVSRYQTGVYDNGGAEIPAFDPISKRVFSINGGQARVDVLDMNNAGQVSFNTSLTLPGITGSGKINSVAVKNGVVAVSANDQASNQNGGRVFFFNAQTGALLGDVGVGAVPDMVTFTPDGTKLLVANEGEPSSYGQAGSVDPEGSVSIIPLSFNGVGSVNIGAPVTAGFGAFNGQAAALRAQGVRLFGPGASVAQDVEPEYISVSADSRKAFVTLQEANALATIDLTTGAVESIKSFGLKDHNAPGNGLDASDQDGGINIRNWNVKGMYQPDSIASFQINGQTFHITANEGDAREYTGLNEVVRVGNAGYVLDPTAFPNAATLKQNANLGRLNVTTQSGDTDGDGDFDEIHVFGGRSFSVWSENGTQVWDSGDDIEQLVATTYPANFGASNTNNTLDNRSDDKGPEPEGVVVGEAYGKTLAFIGLERIGGVLMYDVSNPFSPVFLDYINTRDFTVTPSSANVNLVGDLGPEGLVFIPAVDSPTGVPLLVVGNEISGTVAVYSILPTPGAVGVLALGGLFALRRRR